MEVIMSSQFFWFAWGISPGGAHHRGFLNIPIPYLGLLFSLHVPRSVPTLPQPHLPIVPFLWLCELYEFEHISKSTQHNNANSIHFYFEYAEQPEAKNKRIFKTKLHNESSILRKKN